MSTNTAKKAEAPKAEAKKPDTAPKAEAPKAEKPEKTEVKAPAPKVTPDVNTDILAVGEFGPKPTEPEKRRQNTRDFLHAHIGPERLAQIDGVSQKTGYSRTKLAQMAWDNFVAREDVKKYL